MYWKMAKRILHETDKRLVWKFVWNMGFKGVRSVQKFKNRLKRGEYFPPFLYISIINSCNLRCQGCWVDVAAAPQKIDVDAMDRLIHEAKAKGNSFFGIVGGEPFLHPELMTILARHPDAYFQLFTNGHFITEEVARQLRRIGNVTPLISVEGTETVSDQRRGRRGVLSKTMAGLQNCVRQRLLTGVATSVCQSNFGDLVNDRWVDQLIEWGVMYFWFHTYRPVGPQACVELALTPEQQREIRRFVVRTRASKPIGVVDAYFDHDGQAVCPAATGISHHINPWGDIEPCPIVQFATDSIHDPSSSLAAKFNSSFLHDFRRLAAESTRGCIVLERPELLEQLVQDHQARDTTARQQALAELQAMTGRASQWDEGHEIPEQNWLYRVIKKHWYHDFGAYAAGLPLRKAPARQAPEVHVLN
ncbi:MAG: radical SAM protein [Planctomycetales bacterium]|nr:radical SAM protein [Planctomycetales bacterium]